MAFAAVVGTVVAIAFISYKGFKYVKEQQLNQRSNGDDRIDSTLSLPLHVLGKIKNLVCYGSEFGLQIEYLNLAGNDVKIIFV